MVRIGIAGVGFMGRKQNVEKTVSRDSGERTRVGTSKVGGKQVRLVDKKGDYIRGQEREADALVVWHEMMAMADALVNKDDNSVRLILGLCLECYLKVNAAEKSFKELFSVATSPV